MRTQNFKGMNFQVETKNITFCMETEEKRPFS